MVLKSRRFKLEYNDASTGTTIIAEKGQDTGALKINRLQHIRRRKDPNILKLWLDGTDFGENIPTRKSEFGTAQNGTDEPEILFKQYNNQTDSFETQGRFYAKNTGTINENGELALKLYSFLKYTGRQEVDTTTTTTNIEDALNTVLPSGYVADVPSGATVPTVDGYSINARREKGYFELTTDFKWTITFTSELDSNNDYKVKFEPQGFGGTVDTIIENTQAGRYPIIDVDTTNDTFTVSGDRTDELVVNQAILVNGSTGNDGTYTIASLNYDSTANTITIGVDENVSNSTADGEVIPGGQAVFKSWEKDKTDSIINKVTVEGTDSNGVTVTGTATNQTQIGNFGEKFLKVKRGYIQSTSDAENIAEGYLVPGLNDDGTDITKVPENGTVKTVAYSDNVVNDSFQVVGNNRNIDDTYTVVQQRNYWPEGSTELEFEFEQENLEEAARDSENLRDERARLFPSGQTDVGNQNVTTGDALSNTSKIGGVGDTNDRNDDLSNVTKSGQVLAEDSIITNATSQSFDFTGVDQSWTTITLPDTSASGLKHTVDITVDSVSGGPPYNFYFTFEDDSGGNTIFMESATQLGEAGSPEELETYHRTFPIPEYAQSGSYTFSVYSLDGTRDIGGRVEVVVTSHEHDDNIVTDNNSMGLTDDVATEDNNHGGGSGDDQHGGDTDTKNIDVATEDKTDR